MKPITLLLILLILFGFAQVIQSEVPRLINYQGKLTTPQGAPLDTIVSMQFSIYPDSTGGTPLWTETQLSVRVDKGIFNTLLGSVTEIPDSVFSGAIRYLGVNVGDDPELTPRKSIVSVGYAYRVSTIDGASGGTIQGDMNVEGDLIMTGNTIYVDEISIEPTVRYNIIPAYTFWGFLNSGEPVHFVNECHIEVGYGGSFLFAPIQLPHGATISEATVYYGNITGGQCSQIQVEVGRVSLFEKPNCPMQVMGSVLITEPPTIDYDSLTISSFSNATIDNSMYSYSIKISADCWHYWLYNVRIKFVINKPLP